MAFDMMDLLGAVMEGGMSSSSSARAASAASSLGGASGLQGLLGGLMGGSGSLLDRAGSALGGKDNLAATGIGALLGALSGKKSTTLNGLGGGVMGLLGMMAYKALKDAGQSSAGIAAAPQMPQRAAAPQAQNPASDAEILLTAMLDAAKADGQVDADELNRIVGRIKATGVGQEGLDFVIRKLQAPMETERIVAAARGRPELAAQIYSASLMAIDVDTDAERAYLARLAKALGLSEGVVRSIEQIAGMQVA